MSVVWACRCSGCGKDIDYSCSLDADEDLIVTVEVCQECRQGEVDESYERGRSEGYDDGWDDGHRDGLKEAEEAHRD